MAAKRLATRVEQRIGAGTPPSARIIRTVIHVGVFILIGSLVALILKARHPTRGPTRRTPAINTRLKSEEPVTLCAESIGAPRLKR
jgi:hypothetical protein